ncbi:LLM class flavin-dependent oxidoreductase [Amycolatopsis sp.]|uniref:LLM class flavin-dependent oxidoreductase n=1 Tax=Amycolatopsis sp. TaxID=37632 RepID=UPI002BF2DFA2|nr:LLM class flavin-dependent oxidoreductase [Amycolatopsis sp.]HVV12627.1 LLM class flavin-dependent oxidoreductase [Amycolatopsis sp.]
MPPGIGFALDFRTSSRDIGDVARGYEDVLDTIAYADRLGTDSVWVGQHHSDNTDGPFASPLPFLVAAASRTSRLTPGTGITTLPFEDPIRPAEDAAVVDALSGGRVHHEVFAEKVARSDAALEGKPPAPDGPRLCPPGACVRRQLGQAATSVESAAGGSGDGLRQGAFFDPADTGQAPKARACLEAHQRARPDDIAERVATDPLATGIGPAIGWRAPLSTAGKGNR